ncbi:MAG: F0F1 ATP synthase subunit delta, partial [Candidatus Omnitrophica bacterium]|nr:F0F1 ATP synthase subunit delta [Candidatus Omnitrophota bacterium]
MLIQLLILQILTFIGLIFLLKYLFTRNLNAALTRLNALHEENLMKETQLNEELKRAQAEREAEVLRGRQEANALIEEAKVEALKLRQKQEEAAREEALKIVTAAKRETNEMHNKLFNLIQLQALEVALKIIEETFTEKNKEYVQHQFISEIIEEIAKLPKEKFTVLSERVKVVSSFPLEDKQRQELKKVLEEKLGIKVVLEEGINKSFISGLTLDIG